LRSSGLDLVLLLFGTQYGSYVLSNLLEVSYLAPETNGRNDDECRSSREHHHYGEPNCCHDREISACPALNLVLLLIGTQYGSYLRSNLLEVSYLAPEANGRNDDECRSSREHHHYGEPNYCHDREISVCPAQP